MGVEWLSAAVMVVICDYKIQIPDGSASGSRQRHDVSFFFARHDEIWIHVQCQKRSLSLKFGILCKKTLTKQFLMDGTGNIFYFIQP